jgi:hypothetical protein
MARYNVEMGPPVLAPLLVTMVGGNGPGGRPAAPGEVDVTRYGARPGRTSGTTPGAGGNPRFPGYDVPAPPASDSRCAAITRSGTAPPSPHAHVYWQDVITP